ncbi:MAG: hypothetical protein ACE5R4_15835 [Armatimonadota bacterium]
MELFRLRIPLAITFIAGVALIVQFFIPSQPSEQLYKASQAWLRIIGAFAAVLGVGSILRTHLARVRRAHDQWPFSALTLAGLFLTAILGIGWGVDPGSSCHWIFMNIYTPLDATIFSLLAFYVASAAYRTFRVRTLEAGLLLAGALLVMFARVSLGEMVHDMVPRGLEWLLTFPAAAAKRGILLGIVLGVTATSMRIILGIERAYLGAE